MVIFVDVDVNKIAQHGRDFPWRKPSSCPHCQSGLWWHGFVPAYFEPLSQAVFLRRLRCPRCGAVHRLRPKAYWSRFRSTIQVISQTIDHFINQEWQSDLPESRQRQWWRRFKAKAKLIVGFGWWDILSDAFDLLVIWGQIPVSSAIQSS